MDLPATKFVIKDLLPQGLAIIGGSPKVGKSWLMLDWCVRIAKGEKIWNFPVTQGTTLYVSLEDTASRLQERLLSVTDEAPETSTADSNSNLNFDGELPITGWESERGILEEALLGGGTDQEQPEENDLGLSYPDNSLNHLGTDTAYLAADMMNILDNDSHTEDCTTTKKTHHEHKNTLGGM